LGINKDAQRYSNPQPTLERLDGESHNDAFAANLDSAGYGAWKSGHGG
jgi:hypothetical protein